MKQKLKQAKSQPGDNRGSFSSDFGPISGFENWSSLGETSVFKIIMTDDVTLW